MAQGTTVSPLAKYKLVSRCLALLVARMLSFEPDAAGTAHAVHRSCRCSPL